MTVCDAHMKSVSLWLLSGALAGACWLPTLAIQNIRVLDLIAFVLISISAACFGYVAPRLWWTFGIISGLGTAVAFWGGISLWPTRDIIAIPWIPISVIASAILSAILGAAAAFFAGRSSQRGSGPVAGDMERWGR